MVEHGRETRVYAAQYDISAYLNNVDIGLSAATHETQTLGDADVERSRGLGDGSLRLSGFFDAAYSGYLASWLGSAAGEPITVAFGGAAFGDTAILGQMRTVEISETAPVGDMVGAVATVQPHGGLFQGHVLTALSAKASTTNGATQDDAASSAQGGKAAVHCTTVTGTEPTCTVKIQHSANGSDWADLSPSFTQLTAAGSQVINIAAGTTVNRYVREYHTIGGTDTPTFTFLVSFGRRFSVP